MKDYSTSSSLGLIKKNSKIAIRNLNPKLISAILFGLILTFSSSTYIYSQMPEHKVVPPSPDAAALGTYGTIPVGLFTGTIQQNIPLYELKTAELNLPITLNYSSNGLIVDKVASWVGYDWILEAGGVITLSVQGKHDNETNRPYLNENELTNLYNFLYTYRYADFQPDVYHFNFAGYSGQFIIDSLGLKAITIPFQNLKIETSRSGGNMLFGHDFIITTPDGVKYSFTVKERTTVKEIYYEPTLITYPTAWYLTSITHPTGDKIDLYYSEPTVARFYSGISQQIFRANPLGNRPCYPSSGNNCPPTDPHAVAEGTYTQVVYLDSITSSRFGKIVFVKSTELRKDFKEGKKLDVMIIKNYKNEVIRSINFKGSYIKSFGFPPGGLGTTIYWRENGYQDELEYRLFLNSLEITDKTNTVIQKYSFYYNNLDALPSRLSFAQDHWGYFNGIHNAYIVPQGYLSGYLGLFPETFADRTPNSQYSRYGMLNKIIYPTGGYCTIDYESHSDGASPIGGCRVKKTSTYENGSATPIIKIYSYSPGTIRALPSYFRSYYTYYPCYNSKGEIVDLGSCNYVGLTSSSIYSLYINSQYHIGYSSIDISYGENFAFGGESHQFEIGLDGAAQMINPTGSMPSPLPFSNQSWYTGTKRSETIFKIKEGIRMNVKITKYNYNRSDNRNRKEMLCLSIVNRTGEDPRAAIENDITLLRYFDVAKYYLFSVWQQPTNTVIENYDDDGNVLTSVTNYYYDNPKHCQLSRDSNINSQGKTVEKKYYYPQDYTTSSYDIGNLKNKFILNKPIDIRTYTANKITSLEQYKYNSYGQTTDYYKADISPSVNDIAFNGSSPYTATHKLAMTYNTDKKLMTTQREYDIPTSYIWGYNNMFPVVKIEGISYSELLAKPNLIDSIAQKSFTTSSSIALVKKDVDGLKSILSALMTDPRYMVTFYTYSPLVGMTSQTDSNGKTTYYEYDSFGRLLNIKDQDQISIQEYKYNYKQ